MKLLNHHSLKAALCGVFIAQGLLSAAHAGERRFAYLYEAKRYVPGEIEIENWATWKTDDDFDRIDFRHELEFGITERFQLGLYLANLRWQDGVGSEYRNSAVEGIYNILNPNEHWLGLSLYGEVKFAKDFLELEPKLLLQKNFGDFTLAYNFVVESEWEGDGLADKKGEIKNIIGLSYMPDPKFGFGIEGLHEVGIDNWDNAGKGVFYVGPNATARFGRVWLTAAALWEVTDTAEPDFQLRTLVGFHF